MKIEYDYELYRKNAFVIADGKLIENNLHFECLVDLLAKDEKEKEELFEEDDSVLEELTLEQFNNYIIGEVAEVEGNIYIIAYDKKDIDTIKKYYNYKVTMLEDNEFLNI